MNKTEHFQCASLLRVLIKSLERPGLAPIEFVELSELLSSTSAKQGRRFNRACELIRDGLIELRLIQAEIAEDSR